MRSSLLVRLARCMGLLSVLAFLAAGCASLPRERLEAEVSARAEVFAAGSLPGGLVSRASTARVLVLGESHYVEEHQAFLADLATGLVPSGYRLVLQEGMSSLGWMAEDYVQGELLALDGGGAPGVVAAFDRLWLERLRAWNLAPGRPASERIHVGYFDMNHWGDIFQASLVHARDHVDTYVHPLPAAVSCLPEYSAVLASDPFARETAARESYVRALSAFAKATEELATSSDPETARWAGRLASSAGSELASAAIRADWSDEKREAFMFSRLLGYLDGAEAHGRGTPVIVNCGMNHAQKEAVLMGPRLASVARRLGDLPAFRAEPALRFIVAVAPASGEWIEKFQQKDAMRFDLLRDSPGANLLRVMGEAGKGGSVYLDFGRGLLASSRVLFEDRDGAYDFVPERVFDACILLPRATLPASLAPYRK